MATFEGTLADFTRYLDPYLRNTIQRGTRAHRSRLDHVCQACGRTFLFLCKPCHDEYDERNKARQTTPRRVMPA